VTLPPLDRQRLNALARLDVVFKPGVFSGDAFPRCDFADPAAATELIGPYTLKAAFYDADHQPAERPARPGRYGAVIDIVTPAGPKIPSRLVTLYKQPEPAGWTEEQFDARILALPRQVGVDPRVVGEQQNVLREHASHVLRDALVDDVDTPLLVAALAESKAGDPPLAGRNSVWARNERWWYPLKQKLGRSRYEYRVDVPRGHLNHRAGVELLPPVLLYLHGSGERGDDLDAVHGTGPAIHVRAGHDLPFLIVSPQCPAGESWSVPQLKGLLDEVASKYRIDADRVYLTGLSMGGYGVWELAAEYPDRFAAIAPICGAGGPGDAGRLRNLPAWVFHGQQDREVPFGRSVELVEARKRVGGRVRFTPYPDLGHDCWTTTYNYPELYEWLLKQQRGAPAEPPSVP
jgi:hypothetical protein